LSKTLVSFSNPSYGNVRFGGLKNCSDFLKSFEGSRFALANKLAKVSIGQWYHLAYVYKRTEAVIFVNGQLYGHIFDIPFLELYTHNKSSFGEGGVESVNVLLDEIKLYNKALNYEQIVLDMVNVAGGIANGIC
jgi:hypothetical protein